ncbi:AbrB/MazE/SpoVT family DNA-binding domain-containing protein [Lederbergia sp. NSJ-179]|uniref:AbrB/MazE/SpoVT family DNA-binding domain-containing protein n=1 Tax=Lederbergia sp. NSJ-179 TaxID=2931402 RepID=UPI001FD0AB8C|nr:AbrB/MazE/SpoVT family DNA-binding domain-containing protein [Lederbergia sp. NSJ-179]MCJ7841973.1 AbrB/MazE/SpoVT family DNA-binding domain-containing protein [Lederbergia sp. NSJ-179]
MELNNSKDEVFRMTTTAQKWGNSIGVRIPQKIAKKFGVVNGSEIEIKETKDGIVLKPLEKEISLDDLLSQITEENRHEPVDWGKPEGAEIW